MKLFSRRRWVWAGMFGTTHKGYRYFVLGVPVWYSRRPIEKQLVRPVTTPGNSLSRDDYDYCTYLDRVYPQLAGKTHSWSDKQ